MDWPRPDDKDQRPLLEYLNPGDPHRFLLTNDPNDPVNVSWSKFFLRNRFLDCHFTEFPSLVELMLIFDEWKLGPKDSIAVRLSDANFTKFEANSLVDTAFY